MSETGSRSLRLAMLSCVVACAPTVARAAPPGWTLDVPIAVTEHSGVAQTGFQVRLMLDTAAMIAAGSLRSDAGDLRFGADAAGTMLLDHWIERGIGTANTVVWVRLPALPPSTMTGIHLFAGNPAATSTSTLQTFDYAGAVENSAVNQISGGEVLNFHNSQRGFRFSPSQDLLMLRLGRNEPNGTVRYLTLFDYASQAILVQLQVGGAAGAYSYTSLPEPRWLTRDTHYVLELYQGPNDGYYYSGPPSTWLQINPLLNYHQSLSCNNCTKDTFPTTISNGSNYGYPDFQFMTRKQASPEPTVVIGEAARATRTVLSSDRDHAPVGTSIVLTAVVHGPFAPGGTVAFVADGQPIAGCAAVVLPSGPLPAAICTTTALAVGSHAITATYGGDAYNLASSSDAHAQTVIREASTTQLFTLCRTVFVEHQPFTMFADVGGYVPGGTVAFTMGGNTLCAASPIADGLAGCTVANFAVIGQLPQNTHLLGADYAGDVNNTASVSATLPITVLSAAEYLLRSDFETVPAGCPMQ